MLKSMAVICLVLIVWLLPVEGARTYIVDDDGFANYDTIGEAVAAASSGDTIYLKAGNYREGVVLDKQLKVMPLMGETEELIINAKENESGIKIKADGCSVEGLTIENFTLSGVDIASNGNTLKDMKIINTMKEGNQAGIIASNSHQNVIERNSIDNCFLGVFLWQGSSDNRIEGNTARGCAMSFFTRDASLNNLLNNAAFECNYGFYLMNSTATEVSYGDVDESKYGVALENSSDNSVRGCVINNSTEAIGIGGGFGNEISENTIVNTTGQSLELIASHDNRLIDNKISRGDTGIIIIESSKNELQGNELEDIKWGMYLEGSARESYDNHVAESNIIDGKPIIYRYAQAGDIIADREIAHLTLAYCNNFSVERNKITNDAIFLFYSNGSKIRDNNITGYYGMRLLGSKSNLISGNKVIDNRFSGIFLVDSSLNEITGNIAEMNNQNGISLFNSSGNTVSTNLLKRNRESGLWLNYSNQNRVYENNISLNPTGAELRYSSGNLVYHNNFMDNDEHARDIMGNNSWDTGNVTGGNYWSGQKVVGNPSTKWTKAIKGGEVDRYPFQDPSGWAGMRQEPSADMALPRIAIASQLKQNESKQNESAQSKEAQHLMASQDLVQNASIIKALVDAQRENASSIVEDAPVVISPVTEDIHEDIQIEEAVSKRQPAPDIEMLSSSQIFKAKQPKAEDQSLPEIQSDLAVEKNLNNQTLAANESTIVNQLHQNESLQNLLLQNSSLFNNQSLLFDQPLVTNLTQQLDQNLTPNQSLSINQSLLMNQSLENKLLPSNQSMPTNQSLRGNESIPYNQSALDGDSSSRSQVASDEQPDWMAKSLASARSSQNNQSSEEGSSKASNLISYNKPKKIQQLSPSYQGKVSS